MHPGGHSLGQLQQNNVHACVYLLVTYRSQQDQISEIFIHLQLCNRILCTTYNVYWLQGVHTSASITSSYSLSLSFCYAAAVLGFEMEEYTVNEGSQTAEVCLRLFEPNPNLVGAGVFFSVTLETADNTAIGMYVCM